MNFRDVYGIISARGNAKIGKNPCTFVFMGAVKKYKYRNKQISLTDFNTPVGMKLNPDNRWVKKAELIPWDEIEERYPERILADKIYRNRENLAYCAERKIRLSGPALGRPKKDEIRDKKQDYLDEADRVEVERKFSLAKRKCGIGLIVTRLKEKTCHCLAMSVLLMNLRKIGKVLLAEILKLLQNLLRIYSFPEMAIIQ